MTVEMSVGAISSTNPFVTYLATGGQMNVTLDANGKYHYTSVASIPVAQLSQSNGGIQNAPATMALNIVNAY